MGKIIAVWIAFAAIAILLLKIGDQQVKIAELERQQLAYGWKVFSCKVLLDDPDTRRIMCTPTVKSKQRRTK